MSANIAFGPFNLDYSGKLKIENLCLTISHQITNFSGENGIGKSVLMNLMVNQSLEKGLKVAKIEQDYRKNWLWWKTPRQNLELASSLNSKMKLTQNPLVQDEKTWLEPLLQNQPKQVDFSRQELLSSATLSGGQLQKLILFRELLASPEIVFLDEAFSALDELAAKEIITWIKKLQTKMNFKIVSIAHDSRLTESFGGQILKFFKDPSTGNLCLQEN